MTGLPLRNPRRMVSGNARKNGSLTHFSRTFSARNDEAAKRYWVKWVEGMGYEPTGKQTVRWTR